MSSNKTNTSHSIISSSGSSSSISISSIAITCY